MFQGYDKNYFDKTAEDVGLILKERRPLWKRWVKIIRRYKKSGKLLDVGCGPGFFLEYAEKYYDVYGIDISEYAIKEAKYRTNQIKLSLGDATKLDYKNDYFDIVTCFDLLEHLPDPVLALREFHRVSKKDGILVIRVPNTDSIGASWKKGDWFGYRDKTHISLFPSAKWTDLLTENGFVILEVFYDGLWDTPYFKRIPKILQVITIKFPSLMLFGFGVKFSRWGENLCIVARRAQANIRGVLNESCTFFSNNIPMES